MYAFHAPHPRHLVPLAPLGPALAHLADNPAVQNVVLGDSRREKPSVRSSEWFSHPKCCISLRFERIHTTGDIVNAKTIDAILDFVDNDGDGSFNYHELSRVIDAEHVLQIPPKPQVLSGWRQLQGCGLS